MTVENFELGKVTLAKIQTIDEKLDGIKSIKDYIDRDGKSKGRVEFGVLGYKFSMDCEDEEMRDIFIKTITIYEKALNKKKSSLEKIFEKL